jgi:hypothetical protein
MESLLNPQNGNSWTIEGSRGEARNFELYIAARRISRGLAYFNLKESTHPPDEQSDTDTSRQGAGAAPTARWLAHRPCLLPTFGLQ